MAGNACFGTVLEGGSGARVRENNVEQLTAHVAPVGLMEGTPNPTVVGFRTKTNVSDEGGRNILAGVNSIRANPPSPAIRKAMSRKLEAVKSARKL